MDKHSSFIRFSDVFSGSNVPVENKESKIKRIRPVIRNYKVRSQQSTHAFFPENEENIYTATPRIPDWNIHILWKLVNRNFQERVKQWGCSLHLHKGAVFIIKTDCQITNWIQLAYTTWIYWNLSTCSHWSGTWIAWQTTKGKSKAFVQGIAWS